jgi:rod shape-determining protein MreD
MKRAALIVFMGVMVVLQLSLLPGLRPFGVVPNVALVGVVLSAIYLATSEVLVAAAVAGLILDIVSGPGFGLWTGVFILVTLVAGLMQRSGIEITGTVVALGLVAAGTLVISLVLWVTLIAHAHQFPVFVLSGRLLVELVLNLGLTVALKPVARWMFGGGQSRFELGG